MKNLIIEIWNDEIFVAEIYNVAELLEFTQFTDVIFITSDKSIIWNNIFGWSEAV